MYKLAKRIKQRNEKQALEENTSGNPENWALMSPSSISSFKEFFVLCFSPLSLYKVSPVSKPSPCQLSSVSRQYRRETEQRREKTEKLESLHSDLTRSTWGAFEESVQSFFDDSHSGSHASDWSSSESDHVDIVVIIITHTSHPTPLNSAEGIYYRLYHLNFEN